jgi:hypothetical protein
VYRHGDPFVVAERKRHTRVQEVLMPKRSRYAMAPGVKGVCPKKKKKRKREEIQSSKK